jgi:hypothetical protein
VIRLHRSCRDQGVSASRLRVSGHEPQLAHLVSTERERNRIVPFHQQTRRTPQHAAKVLKLLAW